jgi:hypothetical protein
MPLVDGVWWRILMAAADRAAGDGRTRGPATGGGPARRGAARGRGRAPRAPRRGPAPAGGSLGALAALYHATLAGEAAARAAPGGDASLQRFLTDVGARAVGVDEVPAGTADDLLNVNVPGDAAVVERRWSGRR